MDVAEDLRPVLEAHDVRPQLIRRPGRRARVEATGPSEPAGLALGVADTVTGTLAWGRWREPGDVVAFLRTVLDRAGDLPGGRGTALPWPPAGLAPVVLVCTHGRRDVCCALDGRPVVATLTDHFGAAVWETSHLGGHRFSATLALLPEGTMYGRLDPSDAARVLGDHADGRVDTAHWRGRSAWSGPVNAAVAHVLATQDGYAAGVTPGSAVVRGSDAWTVPVSTGGDEVVVTVTRHLRPAAALSCGPSAPKPAPEFRAGP